MSVKPKTRRPRIASSTQKPVLSEAFTRCIPSKDSVSERSPAGSTPRASRPASVVPVGSVLSCGLYCEIQRTKASPLSARLGWLAGSVSHAHYVGVQDSFRARLLAINVHVRSGSKFQYPPWSVRRLLRKLRSDFMRTKYA